VRVLNTRLLQAPEIAQAECHKPGRRDGLVGGAGGRSRPHLLRVTTDAALDVLVWLSHAAISREVVENCFAPRFLGAEPLMREKTWCEVWERDRIEELPMYSLGYLDVALWDIAAQAASVPTYKLLGGHKDQDNQGPGQT